MKRSLHFGIILIVVSLFFSSCATYRYRVETMEELPVNSDTIQGKSVAIELPEVSFGATRFALDLRDVKLTINGLEIPIEGRFIKEMDDMTLGKVGLLDVNILEKANVDKAQIAADIQQMLLQVLQGQYDYNFGFMKGLGEKNMGMISNRPVDLNRNVYPYVPVFSEKMGAASLFSSVTALAPGQNSSGYDYILNCDFSISSEIVQVLEQPYSQTPVDGSHVPMQGDYYLSLMGSIRFSLVDTKTGAVVISEKTPNEWAPSTSFVRYVYIPVSSGDADGYRKFFRSFDFYPQTSEISRKAFEPIFPMLAPYCVNRYFAEKVEE